ncbi:hypothetical protein [Deinococcus sp.]|uniref:hypothetical protein n=1 Tax=Deinococcus sp. TaxID=47478 RepID=UPI0025FF94F8|nr:hypothetical protein [Deinococcus sp.]
MRRLIVFLSALSLGIASVAAAKAVVVKTYIEPNLQIDGGMPHPGSTGDIVVTAKRGDPPRIGMPWGSWGSGGSGGTGGGGVDNSQPDVPHPSVTEPNVPYPPSNYYENSWPDKVVVDGQTYDVIRTIRCNCVVSEILPLP